MSRDSHPSGLALADLASDPLEEFARWFAAAEAEPGIVFAEAVCLSTLGPEDTPEGRMVLLKHFDARGFVFYTNLESHKGRALAAHPRAGMTFYWQPLGRQVRIRGPVQPVTPGEADAYFASRPRESRIGAWASDQSRELESREALERRAAELEVRFAGGDVPQAAQLVRLPHRPRGHRVLAGGECAAARPLHLRARRSGGMGPPATVSLSGALIPSSRSCPARRGAVLVGRAHLQARPRPARTAPS